jgi:nucleotide-binding universal stress UspA family protein
VEDERNKILVAVDGSDQADEAVRYVSKALPLQRTEVTLFHVMAEVPEAFLDIGKTKDFGAEVMKTTAWIEHEEHRVNQFLQKSQELLKNAGFPSNAVKIKTQNKKVGIARDILDEARSGYAAVVMGSTGRNWIKDLIMGSTASKLADKLRDMPLAVICGTPSVPKGVLVAFDGSEGAQKAVDCCGSLFAKSDSKVSICHVVRALDMPKTTADEIFSAGDKAKWFNTAEAEIAQALSKAKDHLVEAGFPSGSVTTKIITGKASRAQAIVEQAYSRDFGTIIMGRRGLSFVKEFFMGSVSKKVLLMVENTAVWIVS